MTSRRSLRTRWLYACLTLGVAVAAVRADSITLHDGKTLQGVVKLVDGGYEIVDGSGLKKFIAAEEVKRVNLTNQGKVTEDQARERLASLQRSVESERDLKRIISRYRQFIQMNADTDAATQAEADLQVWQSRREQKMTKVGKRWLTASERDEDLRATAKTAEQITRLLESGQNETAVQMIREGLEDNPENLSLLYLNGVMQIRREQFLDARRSFELVTQQIDGHAPTLLNTAYLSVQFKRWGQAVQLLDQAMTAAPANREILDNVLEFSHLVPDATRRSTPYEKMMGRFADQEATLGQEMARQGLYRWGSRWVDQTTLDQARRDLEAHEKKKADLALQSKGIEDQIQLKAQQVERLQRVIRIMEAEALYTDPTTGRTIRRAYPAAYWDAQRELEAVRVEGRALERQREDLKKESQDLDAAAPKAPFEGKLKPIGERGVPIVLPPQDETSQPAPQPQTPTTSPTTAPSEWRPPLLPPTPPT